MARKTRSRRHRRLSPSSTSKATKCPDEGSSSITDPASLGHRNRADIQNSIDYHWSIMGSAAKTFVVGADPDQMSLRKLVDFW